MSQKSFLDNKKSRKNFPYDGRGGGSTNIWKIPYVSSFLFLKASLSLSKFNNVFTYCKLFQESFYYFTAMRASGKKYRKKDEELYDEFYLHRDSLKCYKKFEHVLHLNNVYLDSLKF